MFWKKDQSVGSFIIWKIDLIKYQFSLSQYVSNGSEINSQISSFHVDSELFEVEILDIKTIMN